MHQNWVQGPPPRRMGVPVREEGGNLVWGYCNVLTQAWRGGAPVAVWEHLPLNRNQLNLPPMQRTTQ